MDFLPVSPSIYRRRPLIISVVLFVTKTGKENNYKPSLGARVHLNQIKKTKEAEKGEENTARKCGLSVALVKWFMKHNFGSKNHFASFSLVRWNLFRFSVTNFLRRTFLANVPGSLPPLFGVSKRKSELRTGTAN